MGDGLNRVMLMGHLGADPELRIVGGGQAVLNLRMATNESYVDRNNVRQERVEWHRVAIWGRRAEALGKILQKGDALFVDGRLQTTKYEKNGETRYSTSVVATNVMLPGRGGGERSQGGGGGRGNAGGGHGGAGTREPEGEGPDWSDGRGSGGGHGGGSDDDIPFVTISETTASPPKWERW